MTIYWGMPISASVQHAFDRDHGYAEIDVNEPIKTLCGLSFGRAYLSQSPDNNDDVCSGCAKALTPHELWGAPSAPSAPSLTAAVDHPPHYGGADDPHEAIKVIEAWGLNFALGSAIKYLCRAGKKDGAPTKEDLQKAVWYIQREIGRLP